MNIMELTGIKISTFGKRRTAVESQLLLTAVVLVLPGLILATTTVSKGQDICTTPGCFHTAIEVQQKMNRSVDPCDDFYRFACGGFLDTPDILIEKEEVSSLSIAKAKIQAQLRTAIEGTSSFMESKPFKLVKNLYKACMNTQDIEAYGVKRLLQDLKELGGWPVLEGEKWNETAFSWIESVYKSRKLGYSFNFFLTFGLRQNSENNTQMNLYVDKFDYAVVTAKTVEHYISYMVGMARILGADQTYARTELEQAFQFLAKLQNLDRLGKADYESTCLPKFMTIGELCKLYPSIPWKDYFNNLLPTSVRVDESEAILVKCPEYITKMVKLLEEAPKRTQANYALWRAVDEVADYTNDQIRELKHRWAMGLHGLEGRQPRWQECLDTVSESLSASVGALYVRTYFHEDTKRYVMEMVDNIRDHFSNMLKEAEWMDEKTRKIALEKVESLTSHIAYPDELLDDRKLEEFYQGLEISEDNYLKGLLSFTRFVNDKGFAKLKKPFNLTHWQLFSDIVQVGAGYRPTRNSIEIPAGILQGVYFSRDRPTYMNYGAIGGIIGHAISHVFDREGQLYDKVGNLVDWWGPLTAKEYLVKAQCIIDQYGNYSVQEVGKKVNGIATQDANIADNGGFRVAYRAYNDWVARHGQEPMLPGLPYTPRQMFWISSAHLWCTAMRPKALEFTINWEDYSPPEFRVVGSLSNLREFSEDFNCPVGSRMNPVKKCAVW